MNTKRIALFLAAGALAAAARAQGPLVPPAAPGPTMKSLAQIEPRTAITNVPFMIVQPGSYYLAGSLTSATRGVSIATNGVALDLMGFTLSGDGSGSGHGIELYNPAGLPVRDVVVRNGSVRRFGYGVWAKYGQSCRFEDLDVSRNVWNGILLDGLGGACDGNAIVRCALTGNGLAAIYFNGSSSGRCSGNRIAQCAVAGNLDDGIYFSGASGGACDANLVTDCVVVTNGDHGFYFNSGTGRCNGNRIARCTVKDNASYGIFLVGSSGQCNGNAVVASTVAGNDPYGVILNGNGGRCDGNVVADCMIGENAGTGIRLNVAAGNRLENNRLYDFAGGTKYGLDCVGSTNNLIVRNSSGGQTYDFVMSVRDVYGPIVTNVGELATNGVYAHPWANYER
ncbi:MAG: right-handed parallel beta-helix repeat-containing protein [Kiritimatiellia bacterium]